IAGRPKVSIIIPTAYRKLTVRGEPTTYLARCLSSIRARSTYPHYEILLLDNDEAPPEIRKDLVRWDVVRTAYPQPFNWAVAVNFNDIDYCLRVGGSGRRVVCNPYARLVHYETATKAAYFHAELNTFRERWGEKGMDDPFYNPNLSTRFHDFRVEPEAASRSP